MSVWMSECVYKRLDKKKRKRKIELCEFLSLEQMSVEGEKESNTIEGTNLLN